MGTAVGLLPALAVLALIAGAVALNNRRLLRRDHAEGVKDPQVLFDGAAQVVYASPDQSGGVPIETLVKQATERGYLLVSDQGRGGRRRVVFKRA